MLKITPRGPQRPNGKGRSTTPVQPPQAPPAPVSQTPPAPPSSPPPLSSDDPKGSIRNWKPDDRPREKLIQRGATALTDAELLAILLGSGSRNQSAVELGRYLLDAYQGLPGLAAATLTDLQHHKGMGEAKALTIVAAFEIARRKRITAAQEVLRFTSPASVAAYLQPHLEDRPHEEFHVLYVGPGHTLKRHATLAIGGSQGATVDIRLILREALLLRAVGFVICHNHPSGQLNPSTDDRKLTAQLADAARVLDLQLLDHIIIGAGRGYFSFQEHNLLPTSRP